MATVIGILRINMKKIYHYQLSNQDLNPEDLHIFQIRLMSVLRLGKNKNAHYSISNKKSYTILSVAKMFNSKIRYLKPRLGERYASALTKISQKSNNKKIRKNTIERLHKFVY